MAQSLSINIDSPAADAPAGPVVFVSGTLSVVGTGAPFVHEVQGVTVRIGSGPVTPAKVTGPLNPSTFPRSFSCAVSLPLGAPPGPLPVNVTVAAKMRGA